MDEAAVRSALASLTADGGAPLLEPQEIGGVVVEGDWVAVALAREGASKDLLSRLHRHLSSAFPAATIEIRAGQQIYRGGAGFGDGRHVLAVFGGKGGVGKSTLAVNLALTLSAMGIPVGLVDGDLNAPDIPHLLGVHPKKAPPGYGLRLATAKITPPSERQRPQERLGVEVMSVGFLVPERTPPVISSRPLVSTLLRHLIFEVEWSAGVVIIDSPPGTGEELQVMARELPLSGALFVTTPQDLAQMDAERTLTLLTENDVPVIGVVQNMASMTCPHCEREIDMFEHSQRLADAGVEVIGQIPFDIALSKAADRGRPLVLGEPAGPVAYEFARIGRAVQHWLANRDGAASEADGPPEGGMAG